MKALFFALLNSLLDTALARRRHKAVIFVPLETSLLTTNVASYFTAANAETTGARGNVHLLLVSVFFAKLTRAKWKMKALSVSSEARHNYCASCSRQVQKVFDGSFNVVY